MKNLSSDLSDYICSLLQAGNRMEGVVDIDEIKDRTLLG
jgi:hypothetical protein